MPALLCLALHSVFAITTQHSTFASSRLSMDPLIPPVVIGSEVHPQPIVEPGWIRLGPDYQIGTGISTQVSIHPQRPAELVLATRPFGMYISVNAGVTWKRTGTPFDAGLNSGPNWGLVRAPSDPDIVYVSLENPGMWRSDDGGRTWVDRSATLPAGRAKRGVVVAVHPQRPDIVWMGTDGGLFKTIDGGRTWLPLTRGLPTGKTKGSGDRHQTISAVRLDPRNPDTVRIGIYATGLGEAAGVWQSDDGGETWRSASKGIQSEKPASVATTETERQLENLQRPDWIHWLVQCPSAPDALYANAGSGVYRSRDSATSWHRLPDLIRNLGMEVDPTDPLRLVAAKRDGGVWLSDDGGETWRDLSAGLPTGKVAGVKDHAITIRLPDGSHIQANSNLRSQVHVVESFAFAPDNHLTLYASATSGLYRITLPPRRPTP